MAPMKDKSADGLRGMAALNVAICHFIASFLPMLLYHNFPKQFPENPNPGLIFRIFESPVLTFFYNGKFPVIIFFVLSGYVLTIPYFKGNAEVLKRRLFGRYVRLNIPILASVLLSYLFYKLHFYQNIQTLNAFDLKYYQPNFPSGVDFTSVIKEALYGTVLYGKDTLNPPLWTLRTEFIGSISLLCFYLCKPKHKNLLLTMTVTLLLYIIFGPDSIYFIAIFLGAALNLLSLDKKWNIPLFILGFYFGAFQFENMFYNFLPSARIPGAEIWDKKCFYNTIGGVLLTASILNGFVKSFFESKIAQFLGKISFSFYLLHFLVLYSFCYAFYTHFPHTKILLLLNFTGYLGICLLISPLFTEYIDKIAIKMSHKFSEYLFKT